MACAESVTKWYHSAVFFVIIFSHFRRRWCLGTAPFQLWAFTWNKIFIFKQFQAIQLRRNRYLGVVQYRIFTGRTGLLRIGFLRTTKYFMFRLIFVIFVSEVVACHAAEGGFDLSYQKYTRFYCNITFSRCFVWWKWNEPDVEANLVAAPMV